jgi:hypothetical protein
VPKSSITCGFDEALSMISIAPRLVPCFAGENHALMVQFAPDATLAAHDDFTTKSGLALIDKISNGFVPVFVSVTVRAVLVVPAACVPKPRGVEGEKVTAPVLSSVMT